MRSLEACKLLDPVEICRESSRSLEYRKPNIGDEGRA
jgi:hypothetical protein